MKSMNRLSNALTLVEALVVVVIVVVLAVMLLPAIAPARENSRRQSCANNLMQFGKAMEGYCADFGQHYPVWTGYGTPLGEGRESPGQYEQRWPAERGEYLDPRDSAPGHEAVYVNPTSPVNPMNCSAAHQRNYYWPTYNYRTIFCGSKTAGRAGDSQPAPTKGNLNVAPHGLGFLASAGYLTDISTFYCPSTNDMPAPYLAGVYSGEFEFRNRLFCMSSPAMLKQSGVDKDPREVMYADFTWYKPSLDGKPSPGYNGGNYYFSMHSYHGRSVLGHYNYRCVPATTAPYHEFYQEINKRDPAKYPDMQSKIRVLYIKPAHVTTNYDLCGSTVFKTQKTLGNRAIISDSFSRALTQGAKEIPGNGYYGHRDGYNVLYGDWHAKWYGDPDGRFAWYTLAPAAKEQMYTKHAGSYGTAANMVSDYVFPDMPRVKFNPQGSMYAWHLLDVAAGVDVDAESK